MTNYSKEPVSAIIRGLPAGRPFDLITGQSLGPVITLTPLSTILLTAPVTGTGASAGADLLLLSDD